MLFTMSYNKIDSRQNDVPWQHMNNLTSLQQGEWVYRYVIIKQYQVIVKHGYVLVKPLEIIIKHWQVIFKYTNTMLGQVP